MLGMMMGMLPTKEARSKVHTTNTDGKSTHDAHEDDSETCGAPLDAGACFCSNLLDFVSLHDYNLHRAQLQRHRRRALPSHAHPCAHAHAASRTRTRRAALRRPAALSATHHLPVAQRVNACSSRAVDRCDFSIVNATSGARVAFGVSPRSAPTAS